MEVFDFTELCKFVGYVLFCCLLVYVRDKHNPSFNG